MEHPRSSPARPRRFCDGCSIEELNDHQFYCPLCGGIFRVEQAATPNNIGPDVMQKLLQEMSAQVENRIAFPLSYSEGRAIIAYIRSLESALRTAKEGIEELPPRPTTSSL
jgi:hypothetical protein